MAHSFDADQVTAHEKTTWNRCASIYEATLVPFTQQGYELVAETGPIGPGKKILDIGCGPGVFTERYAQAGADIIGIDFSEQMIRIAKDQFPKIEFRVADAEQLPFENDTFDLVVGVYVVHHLARPRVVFESMVRIVFRRGLLFKPHHRQRRLRRRSWVTPNSCRISPRAAKAWLWA
jgi:ubiquinone/menaquinone biosynthesis C-methylase UbiE